MFLPEIGDGPQGSGCQTEVRRCAGEYWDVVISEEVASAGAALRATEAGDLLLTQAGHYRRAVVALRTVWHERFGTHLNGVFDPVLDSLMEPGLLRYV